MILVILTIIYTIIKCVTDKYIIIMKKASSSILLIVTFCCMVAVRAQAPMRTLPGNYLATPLTRISIEDSEKYSCPADWGSTGEWYRFCGGFSDSLTQAGFQNNGNFIVGNQMTTDHPIKIVGIAASRGIFPQCTGHVGRQPRHGLDDIVQACGQQLGEVACGSVADGAAA